MKPGSERPWRPKSSAGVAFGTVENSAPWSAWSRRRTRAARPTTTKALRAGNAHVRRVIVQLAWGWIRHQPDSALTLWYQQRFGSGGKRVRKIGIVALARKLLIALWRYLETGVVPDGAQLKPIEV